MSTPSLFPVFMKGSGTAADTATVISSLGVVVIGDEEILNATPDTSKKISSTVTEIPQLETSIGGYGGISTTISGGDITATIECGPTGGTSFANGFTPTSILSGSSIFTLGVVPDGESSFSLSTIPPSSVGNKSRLSQSAYYFYNR